MKKCEISKILTVGAASSPQIIDQGAILKKLKFTKFLLTLNVLLNLFLGTCNKRREDIEKDLNELFQEFMDQEFSIEEAYSHMICARPSKVLSGWTFESKPKPLRSSRTAGEFRETEVFSGFFIQWGIK